MRPTPRWCWPNGRWRRRKCPLAPSPSCATMRAARVPICLPPRRASNRRLPTSIRLAAAACPVSASTPTPAAPMWSISATARSSARWSRSTYRCSPVSGTGRPSTKPRRSSKPRAPPVTICAAKSKCRSGRLIRISSPPLSCATPARPAAQCAAGFRCLDRALPQRSRYPARRAERTDHARQRPRTAGAGTARLGGGTRCARARGRRTHRAGSNRGVAVIRKILPYLIIAVVIAVLAAVLVSRTNANKHQVKNKQPDKPLVVEMRAAKVQPMPILLQAVGQVQSEHSVQVRPQVSGMLKTVDFTEGQTVRKGQRLFSIDSAPYESALAGARAAYASAKAQVERLAPLAGKEYVTGQEYDNARASAGQLQAMLQQAEINLAYTEIRAPIAGRTGSLAVRAGNLIAPADSAPQVVINQMQPFLVQYTVPQQQH